MTVTFDGHGTLHHGDCLEVLPTLADGSVDMVFADLPYAHKAGDGRAQTCTRNAWDTPIDLDRLWLGLCRVGKPACVFVFTATIRFACVLIDSRPKLFRYDLVWEKPLAQGYLSARKMPLRCHESILVFCAKAPAYTPQKTLGPGTHGKHTKRSRLSTNYGKHGSNEWFCDGTRYPRSVQKFGSERTDKGRLASLHPTHKPVALLRWLITTYSRPGDTVLDPTSGSGTTAVAAIRAARRFICIEKDAGYHATAKERLAAEVAAARPEAKALGGTLAARAMAWAEERRRQAGSGRA